MDIMKQRLNFTIRYFHPVDNQWGGYITKNDTVFGIARFLTEKKADLISAFFGLNLERSKVVDFMISPINIPQVFAIRSNFHSIHMIKL